MFERSEEYSQVIKSPATADEIRGNILVLVLKATAIGLKSRVRP
jgi:hypothetical protein